MMKHRKASIEIQFNWIFVIVVGALILFFFITIVNKQRENANKKMAFDMLTDIELILAGQKVSIGRSDIIETPPLEIDLTCDDYSIYGIPRRTGNNIIFSPTRIKGDRMIAWTLDWSVPFRVANFVYLTGADAKYYLIYTAASESLANQLKSEMPKGMNVDVVKYEDINALRYENNYLVRFVYFNTVAPSDVPTAFAYLSDEKVSSLWAVYQVPNPTYDGDVNFTFYKKDRENFISVEKAASVGKETFYGAIFTDDFYFYKCNLLKGFDRLEFVAGLYNNRTIYLSQITPLSCRPFYLGATFDEIANVTEKLMAGEKLLEKLYNYTAILDLLNNNAVLNSCPTLY